MLKKFLICCLFSIVNACNHTVRTEMMSNNGLVMRGYYLSIGMASNLVFGTYGNPTISSLSTKGVGLQVDSDCWDAEKDPEQGDYFLPGSLKSYTLGYMESNTSGKVNLYCSGFTLFNQYNKFLCIL